MKTMFDDGQVTLYLGDWREASMPAVDLVVTDPPYGTTSLAWDAWPDGWPTLAPSASMWCFGSMRMFMDRAKEFADGGWQQSQDIVWEKHNGSSFHADRFRRVHEHAIHFYRGAWSDVFRSPQYTNTATKKTVRSKKRPVHMGHIERTAYESYDGGPKLATSVIFAASMHGKAIHPTEKPVDILLPLLRYGCAPGGLVADLFAGSGSTLVAARIAGMRAIGFEAREEYAERAARRLQQGELFGATA